tara:strand:+ start:2356 stop:3072 length:717 start_codon:yes stop_codon:yes gene_type:complete
MTKIKFVTVSDVLFYEEELLPQPISNFIPEWFKDIKNYSNDSKHDITSKVKTVKTCPSFVDIFQQGYVIPAPVDYVFKVNTKEDWSWEIPLAFEKENKMIDVDIHDDIQMVDHLPKNSKIKKVFKLNLPLRVITPKGYSCTQLPMPYTYNDKWELSYGVLKTDVIHEINLQINILTNEEVLIKQGTPLGVYIPFKREEYNLEITRLQDDHEASKMINKSLLKLHGRFPSQYFKKFHRK